MALSRRRWYREERSIKSDQWRQCVMDEAQDVIRASKVGFAAKVVIFVVECIFFEIQLFERLRRNVRSLHLYVEQLERQTARLRSHIAELENNAAQARARTERYDELRRGAREVKAAS